MSKVTYTCPVAICSTLASPQLQGALTRLCRHPEGVDANLRPVGAVLPIEVTHQYIGGTVRITPSIIQHLLYPEQDRFMIKPWCDMAVAGHLSGEDALDIAALLQASRAAVDGLGAKIAAAIQVMCARRVDGKDHSSITCVLVPGGAILMHDQNFWGSSKQADGVTDAVLQSHINATTKIVMAKPASRHEELHFKANLAAVKSVYDIVCPIRDPRTDVLVKTSIASLKMAA